MIPNHQNFILDLVTVQIVPLAAAAAAAARGGAMTILGGASSYGRWLWTERDIRKIRTDEERCDTTVVGDVMLNVGSTTCR